MDTLFPLKPDAPAILEIPGLKYLPEYITASEESQLTEQIDGHAWDTSWERRRQLYGGAYGEKGDEAPPIPSWGRALADRMHGEGLSDRPFDHMLVNEYLPRQGIALHRDYSPFDRTVASLSLLSPCVMEFRRPADDRRESLLLEARSLLILSDEARYQWQHGIASRKSDRWQGIRIPRARRLSVTFRLRK